ncbi:MAG: response regulator transcription factor [Candidatus Omnitrophica bacterium]|nr:response regulator transcription factor [Candidatus Omnitrophota bacterium]
MIQTLIVDDEAPARNELRRFLQSEADFYLVGEALDGEEALSAIKNLKPAVVFLDIHIPKINGLEIASMLAEFETPPFIVFVTAYDQYAIQAFEMNALDYILKPYDEARFKKACDKARAAVGHRALIKQQLGSLRNYLQAAKPLKLLGHKRNSRERVFIHPNEVLYFHVELTEVIAKMVNGEELLVNASLKSLLELLDPIRFQQTHRAFVVNLDQVEKVVPLFAGSHKIVLKSPQSLSIPLSRRYAQKLKKLLRW